MKIRRLEKGEMSLIILFGLLSIGLFALSLPLYMKNPNLSSQGAFPLLLSILMVIASTFMIFELKNYEKSFETKLPFIVKLKSTYKYLFPGKTMQILLFVIIYAVVLTRIGFIISTFLFLWASMAFLKGRDIKKLFIISIGVVLVILLIFQLIFKVVLP